MASSYLKPRKFGSGLFPQVFPHKTLVGRSPVLPDGGRQPVHLPLEELPQVDGVDGVGRGQLALAGVVLGLEVQVVALRRQVRRRLHHHAVGDGGGVGLRFY